MKMRMPLRSGLMAGVLVIAGMAPAFAGSVTIRNCVSHSQGGLMHVYVGAYNSNDAIEFMTYGSIVRVGYGAERTVQCATARCKILVQLRAATTNSRTHSGTYSGKYVLSTTGSELISQSDAKAPKC